MAESMLTEILLVITGVLITIGSWWCKRVFDKIDKIIDRFDDIGDQLQNLYRDFAKGDSALWEAFHELDKKMERIDTVCKARRCDE